MKTMYGKIFNEEEIKLNYHNECSNTLWIMNITNKLKNNILYFEEKYIDKLPKDGEDCPYLPINKKIGVYFSIITESDLYYSASY